VKIKASFIAAAIALGSSCVCADPLQPSLDGALPPAKVEGIVRSMGLMPVGSPVRKGSTYAVLATNRQGRSVRIVVDARFGKVLAVQRVIAVIPPGAYPVRQPVDAAVPRPYTPDAIRTPDARSPGPVVETQPPALPPEKPKQKSSAAPVSTNSSVVTPGVSAANPNADLKSTGSTSSSPSFPPVQSFEWTATVLFHPSAQHDCGYHLSRSAVRLRRDTPVVCPNCGKEIVEGPENNNDGA
jgi:hypothetical protein